MFCLADTLPIHVRLLRQEVAKRLKPVQFLGRRTITLYEFSPALFAHLWPQDLFRVKIRKGKKPAQYVQTEFGNRDEENQQFLEKLSPLIAKEELCKVTNSHENLNCGIRNCDHRELVLLTAPAKITYTITERRLTITCRQKTKSFSGIYTGK